MELHEEIRRARLELNLSQKRLAELSGIQRRQLSILENGGNVTLSTLRRVVDVLPNLQEFTFAKVRMKPEYVDMENYDWPRFHYVMLMLMRSLDELTKSLGRYIQEMDATYQVDPEGVTERTQRQMQEWVQRMGEALIQGGPIWRNLEDAQERKERRARRRGKGGEGEG